MAEPFAMPYLDSSVFFALVKREQIVCPSGLSRWETAKHIFDDAESGKYKIFTSTATIVEVRRIHQRTETLDQAELRQIQEFFQHQFILTIDVTREIAEKAQELGGPIRHLSNRRNSPRHRHLVEMRCSPSLGQTVFAAFPELPH